MKFHGDEGKRKIEPLGHVWAIILHTVSAGNNPKSLRKSSRPCVFLQKLTQG